MIQSRSIAGAEAEAEAEAGAAVAVAVAAAAADAKAAPPAELRAYPMEVSINVAAELC